MAAAAASVNLILALFGIICLVQFTQGAMECQNLPIDLCAFSVSSSGHRCVLEKDYHSESGLISYRCQASEIEGAENVKGWIENDECIKACGVDRMSVGVSSDSLLDASFTPKLCSTNCYSACPNIVHLYFQLAAAEGVYLPTLCEAHRRRSRVLVEKAFFQKRRTSLSPQVFHIPAAPAPAPSV